MFRKILILVFCFLGGSCRNSSSPVAAMPIEFDPSPATVSGGICVSQARLVSSLDEVAVVVAVTANFVDSTGRATQISFTPSDFLVEPRGIASLDLQFDLGSQGLTVPIEGTVLAVGSTNQGTVQFVGTLRCE